VWESDKDQDDISESKQLSLDEPHSFGVGVAGMADVGEGGRL